MTAIDQFAAHVGLDWADKKHDVCVQFKNGERTFHVIEHTQEALDIWLNELHQKVKGRIAIALELKKGPVVYCAKFVRQTFVEWAAKTVNASYWARLYYQGLREKGKSHQSAIRALAFKWIRIIYRCWKTRTQYDEAKYLLALEARHSPLLKP